MILAANTYSCTVQPANQALHGTAIPLRSIAAGEVSRYVTESSVGARPKAYLLVSKLVSRVGRILDQKCF
jgi:hypothetical protein